MRSKTSVPSDCAPSVAHWQLRFMMLLARLQPPLILFAELAICLDGSKARRVLGFKPLHPSIQVDELQRIIKGFQEDGIW